MIDGYSTDDFRQLFQLAHEDPATLLDRIAASDIDGGLLAYQRALQVKARKKFYDPSYWLFTSNLLQLASDQATAELVADYFPIDSNIIDVGCGCGSDAIALASRTSVLAIDQNDFACQLTSANAALQRYAGRKLKLNVETAIADEFPFNTNDFVHLDPDRRSEHGRSVQLQWHSPDFPTIKKIIAQSKGGSMKLAPACSDNVADFDVPISKQWITFSRSVVQQRWWWGIEAFDPRFDTLSSYSTSSGWRHEQLPNRSQQSLTDQLEAAQQATVQIEGLGSYIGDTDPGLRAADLQVAYARRYGYRLIGDAMGFLTADELRNDSLSRWFRVLAVTKFDAKQIRKSLMALGFDGIILKTRNVRSVPVQVATMAARSGKNAATVFATQSNGKHVAIIAEACGEKDVANPAC